MRRATILLILMVLLFPVSGGRAQTGGGYDLSWWTVDGGGHRLQGGGYTLMGTVGQPDPAPRLAGGEFELVGGFWPGVLSPHVAVYLPVIIRQ